MKALGTCDPLARKAKNGATIVLLWIVVMVVLLMVFGTMGIALIIEKIDVNFHRLCRLIRRVLDKPI